MTMLLGGLWHGAGWTFLIWGGLHGVYLVINNIWQKLGVKIGEGTIVRRALAQGLTFLTVMIAWVFFRASNLDAAIQMLRGMASLNGVALPVSLASHLGSAGEIMQKFGVNFVDHLDLLKVRQIYHIAICAGIAFFAPNTQEIMRLYKPCLEAVNTTSARLKKLYWRPTKMWVFFTAALFILCVLELGNATEFLYFQF